MRLALAQAQKAYDIAEVPVGAVLTLDDVVIASGHNQPIQDNDPTAHAEIITLRHACQQLNNYRLPINTCLYVTLEPCTMCVGALLHARVSRLVFATTEPRAGAVVSSQQLLEKTHYNHQIRYDMGLFAAESSQLLKSFFKSRRSKTQV